MKISKNLLIIVILSTSTLYAQKFVPGITFGVVTSQVDGDRLEGYDKPGIKAGILVENKFKDYWLFSMGLDYIQTGSRKLANPNIPDDRFYILRLNYVEVPFMFGVNIKKKYLMEAGLVMCYLFKAKEDVDGNGFADPDPAFKSYDFPFRYGVGYKINEKWVLKFHHSYSILPIRNHPGNQTWYFDRGQYNNYLVLSLNLYL